MFRNLTIRSLTLLITAISTAVMLIVFSIFYFRSGKDGISLLNLLFILFGALIIFASISLLLERFVEKKLSLIYNFIHDSKVNKPKSKVNEVKVGSLEEVRTDVLKWAEDAEKQIQSLRSLEEYRKNFVGNVSHELKTPIFSIQGYLHTLLDGGIYDEQINIKYIKRAAENADRLQNIVEDLEAISKLEAGNTTLNIKKFDLQALVEDILQDMRMLAGESKISLRFNDESDGPFFALADRDMISQVLINLIENSIKYGKEDGLIEVAILGMGRNLVVEISDNGLGIEEKHLKHLFDRFYRVDTNRSRVHGGSGLGLSIVKHILEAHEQTISVRSTLNEGSTFSFTLRMA